VTRPGRPFALGALLLASLVPAGAHAATPLTQAGPLGRVRLAGPWVVRSDHGDTGIARGWPSGSFGGRSVSVPFATNAAPRRLTGRAAVAAYAGTIAWYRTRFEIPRAGDYALDFQSVNHRAAVWLDGRLLGRHVGEFQPFAATFRATAGVHELVVRTDYSNIEGQKRTGWHRTWFNYGGITREVTLRPLGRSDIATPTLTTRITRGGDALVDVTAQLHNRGGARTIRLQGALVHAAQRVTIPFPAARLAAGATRTIRARVRVAQPALWSPADPARYRLDLAVAGESGWSGETGLRQLTWHGRRMFLNGRRLLLHGASLQEDAYGHGDALTAADMDGIVARLRAVGANATRAQHPLTPALLERLDAAGILVWQELGPNDAPGAWATNTTALRRASRARVRESFYQLQLHPSIIVWSLANEVADDGHPGGQAQFISNVARELHRRDPGRMVGVDVWGTHVPTSDRGLRLYRDLDIVGLTNYAGWYDHVHARGATLRRRIAAAVGTFARAFPDKVLLVSEFGAEANGANASGAPGGYAFQARLLRDHIAVYRADARLAGMLVWALSDFALPPTFGGGSIRREAPRIRLVVGLNQKGLFDYRGAPKPAAAVVRRLFAGLP